MPVLRLLPFLPRGFRAQLACCFALLGTVLALSLSAALGSMLARMSEREASTVLQGTVDNAARLLADGLSLRLREVRVLADSPTLWLEGIAAPRVAQALYRSQAVNPHSVWIGVTDPQGTVRTATGQLLVGVDVSQRPWFIAGLQGAHVGDVHPAKLLAGLLPPGTDGGPLRFVDFAAPIRRNGELLGVLGLHGSWEWTRATIESLLPRKADRAGLEVFVFDRAGQPIYAPGTTLARQVAAGQQLPTPATTAARTLRWRDGVDYLTAARRLPPKEAGSDLGWTVVARRPLSQAYAGAHEAATTTLAIGLVAALLSAAFGWWLAAQLTRPLRLIAGDADAVATGKALSEMAPRRGSREIEQLSRALSGMTRRLLQANADLEQRVQARTAELERANAALERLADHDPLTGLLNRRGLDERLATALASARRRDAPLSLLVVDADHFKRVNDSFGHDVGDQVLRAIAQVLRTRLREVDIVARVGGEEFVVVLPDTGSLGALHVATALVDTVGRTAMPAVGRVTVSIGAAQVDLGHESVEQALRRADAALYAAKQGGRNRCCMADDAVVAPQPLPA